MKKDFRAWNSQKEMLDSKLAKPFFHERQIWSCKIGLNIGFEQDGKGTMFLRPVIILKKFNEFLFWGIPLTHSYKEDKVSLVFIFSGKQSVALLSQLRLLDVRRLAYRMGTMRREDFNELKEKLRAFLR